MLRRLDVRGFKSFANPVSLEFGSGVNVVVGPNGSGKSNLAEAIVWSMGEQRAGRLRAAGMTEVVFSGGEGRPPAGVADVRLTVSPGTPDPNLPAEVEVARRVTRVGEATYQLNGTACRLLDVHETLGGLGLGPDALAVIRQGQVEAVCTARPGDLRAVIEEAAGVALSRRRRRRAEAKLARVAERLERARDLAGELARRQATLERQARAGGSASEGDAQIGGARARLAGALAATALHAERAATDEVHRCTAERDAAAQRLEVVSAARTAAEQELAERVAAHDRDRELVRGLQSAIERLRGRADLARDRLGDAERQMARDAQQRAAAAAALGEAADEAAQAGARRATALVAAEQAREELAACTSQVAAAEEEARASQAQADDARALADATRRALTDLQARARQGAADLDHATARLARLAGVQGAIDPTRAERRAEVSSERAARWSARGQDADAAVEDARAGVAVAEQRRRELAALAAAVRPGRAPAPDVLGAGLDVAPGTERAFGAALGALADAPAVGRLADADAVLDAGAPAVLVPAPSSTPGTARTDGIGTPLIDAVIACDAGMREHLGRLLADVRLVDSLAEVPEDAPGLFVTGRGDAWRPAHGVRSRPVSDWAAAAEHRAATARVDEAEAELDAARERERAMVAHAALVRAHRRAAERAAARGERELGVVRAHALRVDAERADAAGAVATAEALIGELEAQRAELDAALARADAEAGIAVDAAAAAGEALARMRAGHLDAERTAAQTQADLAAAQLADAEAREHQRLLEYRAGAPELVLDLGVARQAVDALEAVAGVLGGRAQATARASGGFTAAVAAAEAEVTAVRDSHQSALAVHTQATDALHRAELALAAAAARAHELVGDHELAAPEPPAADAAVDPDQAAREIDDLERRRRMIGAVNELAGTEWEETSERSAEIAEQVDDLAAAAAELAAHMQGLDDAVTDGFQQVFTVVQQRFHDAVAVLFPGGRGHLEAVESDDDELGIEIQVVPAGKRPRPLAMMSGGERSLIALAFCLAIAMTRPAPFYLLDEVEAALDDTNLRRFLTLVRRLAEETQFVMITHQQPTVEIADTLFGVTMGADGVSQVVSRRLGGDLAGTARPVVRRQLTAIQGGRA